MTATPEHNAKGERRAASTLPAALAVLTLVTLLAFANAWHDSLVLDDKAFLGPDATVQLSSLRQAFEVDAWMSDSGLYRPLLLIFFDLERSVFCDWNLAYHAVNIVLHLVATLLLFGFARHLLGRSSGPSRDTDLAALLCALVFAVHPVHTEVVNSAFNGSSIIVSMFSIGGLWWLLAHLERHPARAWAGLGLAYTVNSGDVSYGGSLWLRDSDVETVTVDVAVAAAGLSWRF